MFESYKNFINSTLSNLYHPHHTFTGYFQLVVNSMLMIISFLVIGAIIATLIALPFVLYKKISNKIEKERNQIYYRFIKNNDAELENAEYKKLYKKKILYISLFILLIIIIYVPIILPLILILIDNLGLYTLLSIVLGILITLACSLPYILY